MTKGKGAEKEVEEGKVGERDEKKGKKGRGKIPLKQIPGYGFVHHCIDCRACKLGKSFAGINSQHRDNLTSNVCCI